MDILDKVKLKINFLASANTRENYKKELVKHFKNNMDLLTSEEITRLNKNPLRLLDSKNPDLVEVINTAPSISDYYDDKEKQDFQTIIENLKSLKIHFEIDSTLVRGLDYYNDFVFEWVTDQLGAQGTIAAGGRYDSLTQMLGGPISRAVGFALGLERIILLMQLATTQNEAEKNNFLYLGCLNTLHINTLLQTTDYIVNNSQLRVYGCDTVKSVKKHLQSAHNKNIAKIILIDGDLLHIYEKMIAKKIFKYLRIKAINKH